MKFGTAAFGAIVFAFVAACTTESNKTGSDTPTNEPEVEDAEGKTDGEGSANQPAKSTPLPPAKECAAVTTKSKCRTGGDSSIVRGVARFDRTLLSGSGKPTLTLFLRHSFVLEKAEDKVGGRLHAAKRIALRESQLESGVVPFEIDMCLFGVEMWSEENGDFNLVAILDETGAHDIDKAKNASEALKIQTPADGELVKMVSGIRLSCHGESPCLDVPLDCADGTKCTTITPIDKLDCETPSCGSDDSFCSGDASH